MTKEELWGAWAGLHSKPSIPYSIQRRRLRVKIVLMILGVLTMIAGGLAAAANWQAPQI